MIKNFSYIKINSVNPPYLINDEINQYIEESTGSGYLCYFPLMKVKAHCRVLATVKNFTINTVFPIWLIVELHNLFFPNTYKSSEM